MTTGGRGALFVMTRPATGATGPVAIWITAAGWAAASRRKFGEAWILAPEGVLSPEEARALATRPSLAPRPTSWRRRIPRVVLTALRDLREIRDARRLRQNSWDGPWRERDLEFVWQRHDIFQWAGFDAARVFGKPLVLFMDALQVWEARKWGVQRPGWGRIVEAFGELPQIRRADLLACVSEEVAMEVQRRGVPEDRVMVTPCGVDVEEFSPANSGAEVRERLGLTGKFVIGWAGSFRRFHGLEMALDAVASLQRNLPDIALLLVGNGQERSRIERLARDLRLADVLFTGTVPFDEMPRYIAAMDIALLLHSGAHEFHYSPLKLSEYMSSGRAIVGPRVGRVERSLAESVEGLLVPPGDTRALAAAIARLHGEPGLRRALGQAARARAVRQMSWDHQLERVREALVRVRNRAVVA